MYIKPCLNCSFLFSVGRGMTWPVSAFKDQACPLIVINYNIVTPEPCLVCHLYIINLYFRFLSGSTVYVQNT